MQIDDQEYLGPPEIVYRRGKRKCVVAGCQAYAHGLAIDGRRLCDIHREFATLRALEWPRCEVQGPSGRCWQPQRVKGLCQAHRKRLRLEGDVNAGLPIRNGRPVHICEMTDCKRPAWERGLCGKHAEKQRREAKPKV